MIGINNIIDMSYMFYGCCYLSSVSEYPKKEIFKSSEFFEENYLDIPPFEEKKLNLNNKNETETNNDL